VLRHFAYVFPVLVLGEAHHVEDPATTNEEHQEMCSKTKFYAILKVGFPEKIPQIDQSYELNHK
jgi:hypothetical protein